MFILNLISIVSIDFCCDNHILPLCLSLCTLCPRFVLLLLDCSSKTSRSTEPLTYWSQPCFGFWQSHHQHMTPRWWMYHFPKFQSKHNGYTYFLRNSGSPWKNQTSCTISWVCLGHTMIPWVYKQISICKIEQILIVPCTYFS